MKIIFIVLKYKGNLNIIYLQRIIKMPSLKACVRGPIGQIKVGGSASTL